MSYNPLERLGPMEDSDVRRAEDAIEDNKLIFAFCVLADRFLPHNGTSEIVIENITEELPKHLDARLSENFGSGLSEVWEEIHKQLRLKTVDWALEVLRKKAA